MPGAADLGRAIVLAAAAQFGLRVLSLPRLCALLRVRLRTDAQPPADEGPPPLPQWARRRMQVVRRLAAGWPGLACLPRALVLAALLRPLSPTVRIGVAQPRGELRAHAWVEVGGRSLDGEAAHFAPLRAAPGAGPACPR